MKIALAFFALSLLASGCRAINYQDAAGRKLSVLVFGFDTKLAGFTATSPDGVSVKFDNLDTSVDAATLTTINNAISKIPSKP